MNDTYHIYWLTAFSPKLSYNVHGRVTYSQGKWKATGWLSYIKQTSGWEIRVYSATKIQESNQKNHVVVSYGVYENGSLRESYADRIPVYPI